MRHFLIIIILMPFLAMSQVQTVKGLEKRPLITVHVKEFESQLFNGKLEVSISLPKNYQYSSKRYPVIYTLDGEFLMPSVVNISRVRSSRNLMPESIVIGLKTSGTFNRMSIAMPLKREANAENISFANAKPEEFLSFLSKELMPYIDEHYRSASHNTIIGMSPTSGFVLTDYFSKKPLFDAHLALASDPQFFTPDGEALIKKIVQKAKVHNKTRLYLSRGQLDFENSNDTRKKEAFQSLKQEIKNHNLNKQLAVDIIEGGEHYGASLVSLNNGFGFIYPEKIWRPNYLTLRAMADPAQELQHFYQNLTQHYGFTTYPVVDGYWMGMSIAGTVRYLLRNDKHSQAVTLLKWALAEQSKNITLHYYLTAVYEDSTQISKAISEVNHLISLAEKQQHKGLDFYKNYQKELLKIKNKE